MSFAKASSGIALLIAVVALVTYASARSEFEPFDDAARARAPGSFVELSGGQVHYAWHGAAAESAHGNAIVLVHGFSTPSYVWAGLLGPFSEAGRRVLVFDNYGRGFSDRPNVPNDAELFDRQLLELLDSQGVDEPVDLVGYSMGGAIATYFTAHHPERVRRLGLIAPAGFPVNLRAVERLMTAPLIGDWLMAVFGRQVMLDMMSLPENQGRAIPDIVDRYKEQMRYEGYLRSLLSTMRAFPMGAMEAEFTQVGRSNTPVLAIWGDQDSVVSPSNADRIARVIPQAQFETIAGGTHAITYSEPERVAQALIQFFDTTNAARP